MFGNFNLCIIDSIGLVIGIYLGVDEIIAIIIKKLKKEMYFGENKFLL